MAHKYGDRVRESSTTTGTGTFALNGAATGGYQAFSSVCANNDTVFYSISDPAGTKWEVGLGTWQTGGNLLRTAGGVISGSSGAGVLVSFDAGTKDVMLVVSYKSGVLGAGGGAAIASAATLPVPTGRVCHVTGTTNVTGGITATNLEVGTVVSLVFDGVLTVTTGGNLTLDSPFVSDPNCILTVAWDGTTWYEVSRCHMTAPMGEVSYFSTTGTAVAIAAQSDGSTNMVKVAPVTTGNFHYQFDNGGANNGRLRYTGANTLFFHIACTWSAVSGTATDRLVFGVAKNGTVIAASKVLQDVSSTVVQGNAIHVAIEMATNDYLELFVGNMTDADDPTVYTLNLFAMGME